MTWLNKCNLSTRESALFCPILSWCVDRLDRLGQIKSFHPSCYETSSESEIAENTLEEHDRAGERSIGIAQATIGLFILVLHVISASNHNFETLSVIVTSIFFAFVLSSIVRVISTLYESFKLSYYNFLTIIDGVLLVGAIWAYSIAYQIPFEASLKSPTIVFLFTFVGIRALRFSCNAAMLAGVTIIASWGLALVALYMFSPQINVATTYEEFLNSPSILLGTELEKLVALFLLTTGVAVGARRGRKIVLRIANSQSQLHRMAHYDSLTGLPNRVLFRDHLDQALARVSRGETVAVFCLDLDHFKKTNDTLGHPVGDKLLQSVATRLRENIRGVDTIARLGGDEFAIVQSRVEDSVSIVSLAQRINALLSEPYVVDGHTVVSETSIGIAVAPVDGTDGDELIKKADLALYRSKLEGRGQYQFFEKGMDDLMNYRRQLEMDLRDAIANEKLEVHYQPLMNSTANEVTSFEALVRWNHPKHGFVSPEEFISLAEEIRLIDQIGEWVLYTACRDAQSWPEHIRLAVNLSAIQFRNDKLVDLVSDALKVSDLCPSRLELEVTESVLIEDAEVAISKLSAFKDMGVCIALDDFGTGYSSLRYLQSFPFDKIKIDRSFVSQILEDSSARSIVRAVMNLSADFGMKTTAEGIENEEQIAFLQAEGCTEFQGFLFSPACPADELPVLITKLCERVQINFAA